MSANFSGIASTLGNMQYSAGEITGVNAGVQYRDAMRMKNLEAALNIAAQQQAQANLDRQRQDQLRQYRDQQACMARQDQRQAMLDQYGMQQDALANQWKERMFAESQGDKAYARGRDTVMDERYRRGLDMELDKQMYGAMRDKLADQRYATERERMEEQQNYERGRDFAKDQQWKAEMDRQNARVALEDKRYATQEQHWKAQENRANTEMQWRSEDRASDNRRQWLQMLLNNPWSAAAASWFRQPRQTQERQQKPMSISDAREVQTLREQAASGDTSSQQILASMDIPYIDRTPVESRQSLGTSLWNVPAALLGGSGEGWRAAKTGYTQESYNAEIADLQRQIAQFIDPKTGGMRTDIRMTDDDIAYYRELVKRAQDLQNQFAINTIQ